MKCSVDGCSQMIHSLSHAKNHYAARHSGEIETPEKYLNTFPDTEQRDFNGDEPSTEGHDPTYEVLNEPPETRKSKLDDYEGCSDE